MARIRINFGSDFCGNPSCDFCFRDDTERSVKADRENLTNRFRVSKPLEKGTIANQATSCPKCGTWMVVRTNGNTGEKFWGCKNFPSCRGTRPFVAKVKPVIQEKPKEPVKEVTLNDLLARPVSKMTEDQLELQKDLTIHLEESQQFSEKSKS